MAGVSGLESRLAANIALCEIPAPEREVVFHPTRRWRLDFFWREYLVGVEVQGGIYMKRGKKSRHTTGTGYAEDCVKLNEAQLHGIVLLYVTSKMIASGEALIYIERALMSRGWKPKDLTKLPQCKPRKNNQRILWGMEPEG